MSRRRPARRCPCQLCGRCAGCSQRGVPAEAAAAPAARLPAPRSAPQTSVATPPTRSPSPPPAQAMELGPKVAMLPVVDDGRVQGLVTLHALVSAGL